MKNKIIQLVLSAFFISLIFVVFPGEDVVDSFLSIGFWPGFVAFVAVFSSILVTSFRFHLLINRFKLDLSIRTAHFINIMSQLSGLIIVPALAQVVSRVGVASIYTNKSQYMIVMTMLEKISSLFSLVVLASIGGFYAVHAVHVDVIAIGSVMLTLGIIAVSVMFCWRYALTAGYRRYFKKIVSVVHKVRLEQIFLSSLIVHLLTLSSYVIIARFFIPEVSWMMLSAIFSVVMLSASIPISFAGWGIRELAAGFLFSALSLDPVVGISTAAIVGFLSLMSLGAHGVLSHILVTVKKITTLKDEGAVVNRIQTEKIIAAIAGFTVAILIGAQMRIPVGESLIAVNLADPVAIVAGLTFLAIWIFHYKKKDVWDSAGVNVGLSAFGILILLGWMSGYFQYGTNTWATINRVVGLFVIFSYLGAGALFVGFMGRFSIVLLIKSLLIISFVTYFVFILCLSFELLPNAVVIDLRWAAHQFNGLIFNRNAFALQMLIVLGVLLSLPPLYQLKHPNFYIAASIILILASNSRAAILVGSGLII